MQRQRDDHHLDVVAIQQLVVVLDQLDVAGIGTELAFQRDPRLLLHAGPDVGEGHQLDVVRIDRIDVRPALAAGADQRRAHGIAA